MLPAPLTAVQLLWLNLVTDGAPALAREKGDPDIMERKPRPKYEWIIHGPMRLGVVVALAFLPAVAEELTKVIWGWRLESGHRHLHCNVRTPAPAGGARGAVQV